MVRFSDKFIELMELKIKNNLVTFKNVDEIRKELNEELNRTYGTLQIYEKRCLELIDQIEYINKHYGKKDAKLPIIQN